VNTEEEPDLTEGNGISSIPTLMAFRDGILVFEQAGVLPAHSIENLVRQAKSLDMEKIRTEVANRAKPPTQT
jgi:thioredoxin 1